MSRKRVFVTGGSGFIGIEAVKQLLNSGYEVRNYDLQTPVDGRRGECWFQGDILDEELLTRELQAFAPNVVLHLAAKADITATDWSDFASIHLGTANLIKAVRRTPSVNRVINTSTQLVIGPGHSPRFDWDFRPYTIYGEAKAYAEGLFLSSDMDAVWTTLRPTNIWGPHHPSFAQAIWKYIRKGVYLHPSGAPVLRTYGYVGNLAAQIISLIEAPAEQISRKAFYGADDVLDSARWVDAFSQRLVGRPARRLPVPVLRMLGAGGDIAKRVGLPAPIDSGRAMRMTQSYAFDLSDTKAVTGSPPISFDTGIERSLEWLQKAA